MSKPSPRPVAFASPQRCDILVGIAAIELFDVAPGEDEEFLAAWEAAGAPGVLLRAVRDDAPVRYVAIAPGDEYELVHEEGAVDEPGGVILIEPSATEPGAFAGQPRLSRHARVPRADRCHDRPLVEPADDPARRRAVLRALQAGLVCGHGRMVRMGVRAALSDSPSLGRSTAMYQAVDSAGNTVEYKVTEDASVVLDLTHFVDLDDGRRLSVGDITLELGDDAHARGAA